MTHEHTGDILFHCWPHADAERAYKQFESIVSRGFLLTINADGLDSFQYYGGGVLQTIDVMQKARVCFTEIPSHLLHTHNYGHFAIGFQRKTIVGWGGCPAWYLPNHPGTTSLKEMGGTIVRGLHASAITVDNFKALARDLPVQLKQHIPATYLSPNFDIILNFSQGTPLQGTALQNWLDHNREALYQALSYVKELSPQESEDYRYLYEREWRIVDGPQFQGTPVCRPMTNEEVAEFGAIRPDWMGPLASNDVNVMARFPNTRIIDHFRFFNGLQDQPISRSIELILVPDTSMKRRIESFIRNNKTLFRDGGPRVSLYPSSKGRRLKWAVRQLFQTVFE